MKEKTQKTTMEETMTGTETEARTPEASGNPPAVRKKGKKKRWVRRVILTVLILGVLGLIAWNTISNLQEEYRITYDPYVATTGSISNSLSFTGSMQLKNSATYTAGADAKVREVYVSLGDKVKKGDRLVRLSDGEVIEAEFAGTVSTLECEKGTDVKAGDTLVAVADFDHMTVNVRIGESDISSVSPGTACRVSVSSAEAVFDTTIAKINYVDYSGNNVAYYTATVNVDTEGVTGLYPGMQATVTVPLEEAENVVVLKMDALSTGRDNTAFVYKEQADGTMESVPVTVGVSNGNYVEIKEGVEAGETVYVVAEKEEQPTGLAALFSGIFTNRQVNRRSGSGSWQGGGMNGDFQMPEGFTPPSGSDRNSNGSGGFPGGGRGN